VISGVVNQSDLKKQLDVMLAAAEAIRIGESKKEVASAKKRSNEVSSVPS
jgi:hypothetical protein